MKTKTLLLVSALCMAVSLQAQAPQKFNYQGIARTGAGAPMANQTLGLEISILNGTTAQYVERHTATTNAIGLYTVQIGGGTAVTGTMAAVSWSAGNKNIKVGIDPNGGTNYTDLGTTELLSVPYALYAAQGNPGPQGPEGVAGPAGGTGATGATGATGPIGLTGPAGGTGATGATGPAGTPGASGAAGATGPVGPIGPIGPQGIPGTPAAAGWALNGNAATATDFIGTTNDQPLRFKMNGENAGMIGNTGSGSTSLGLKSLNSSTGSRNTAVGAESLLSNTTGERNTAVGSLAMQVNTTGGYNTAVGMESLLSNTTGERNTAVGFVALNANTTGGRNTAIGQLSLYSNSVGQFNTAVGWGSVYSNTTGSNNVGVGYMADVGSGALTNAAAIGATAQVTQSNSLVLGSISGVNSATANTRVGIGTTAPSAPLEVKSTSSATVPQLRLTNNTTGASRIHFQNSNTGAWILAGSRGSTAANSLFHVAYGEGADGSGGSNIMSISGEGNVGIYGALSIRAKSQFEEILDLSNTAGTSKWSLLVGDGGPDQGNLFLFWNHNQRGIFDANSGTYGSISDRRLKENIIPANNILDQIKGIEVMRYTFKADESHQPQLGYIAQNLEEHFPEFVNKPDTESGRESFYTVNYAGMSAVAIKAIQEQQEVIEGQQEKIKEQQEMNQGQQSKIEEQQETSQGQQAMIEALQQAVAKMQARMDELGK